MAAETIQNSLLDMLKEIARIGKQSETAPCFRVKLTTVDAYRVPENVRAIRVISGGAWVSYKRDDSIVRPGEMMTFDSDNPDAVVTALGFRPLLLEMIEA